MKKQMQHYLYVTLFILLIIIIIYVFVHYDQINIWLLLQLVVLRGILAPNCNWYAVSDIVLANNGSGIKTYQTFKQKYEDFAPSQMFGETVYTVINNNYIKSILDQSPNLFTVGKLKMKFFKSFMGKNVGVSTGCPWKARRRINETALVTDQLHTDAGYFNEDIYEELLTWKDKTKVGYSDFIAFGKKMVANIVFNTDHVNDDVFKMFTEANSINAFSDQSFKVSSTVYQNYLKVLNHYIDHPNPHSLVALCLTESKDKEEIRHQIPHFIFPIAGLFVTTIPRLLLLLCNNKKAFKKVIREVYSLNSSYMNNYNNIYQLTYLRYCILETVRLNNPVNTSFRTLTKDYSFDNDNHFKKDTQFLILNNAVLREKEYFDKPDQFNPSRWSSEMEKSYYAISFNQGPQRCPGKELAIFLAQSFIYHFIKIKQIGKDVTLKTKKISTDHVPVVINPCKIKFRFIDSSGK